MTLTIGAFARSFIWAFAGSLVFAVVLFPYGGRGGLVGLQFMVAHTAAIFIAALILYSYPTATTPIYKRFMGLRGLESTLIFLLMIELAIFGAVAAFWLVGVLVSFFGWWTERVGTAWGAAHFVTSAALFLYFYHMRDTIRTTSWVTAPLAISLALLLVPFIYEGIYFF